MARLKGIVRYGVLSIAFIGACLFVLLDEAYSALVLLSILVPEAIEEHGLYLAVDVEFTQSVQVPLGLSPRYLV